MSPAAIFLAFLALSAVTGPAISSSENYTKEATMESIIPKLSIPLKKFIVPSLTSISKPLAKAMRTKIYEYSVVFSSILMRHFGGETEVQFVDGKLTSCSRSILLNLENDMATLQYRTILENILESWQQKLCGQPIIPEVQGVVNDYVKDIIKEFEDFILVLQTLAIHRRRTIDNTHCKKVCSSTSRILNLSSSNIPVELERALANGINFVPLEVMNIDEIKDFIKKDLITAAINYFRNENLLYPLVNEAAGLKTVLEQLISQSPSNSRQIEFYTAMHDQYEEGSGEFYQQLASAHFDKNKTVQNLLPSGTILTESDKGLGPCLLPIDWYVEQYEVQSKKGNHVATNMSEDQCLHFLKNAIQTFRSELSSEGKVFLKKYFAGSNPNYRVGVLKLVPKIHKLSEFDSESWKKLPSRPIRGAENCPINPYSQALCKMLQEMHSSLKKSFSNAGSEFPVIYGCDEYSTNIRKVKFERSTWSLNTLVSGDFSDAYTKSSLIDLQASIKKLGNIVEWSADKIILAQKLSKLVFENCFFEAPTGILRQTQGFPMGGHSSREGLDNILLAAEFDLLCSSVNANLLHYYRLVDDISLAVNGEFSLIRQILDEMSETYPKSMPLNVQISFGYSHFLDSHVYNFLQSPTTNSFTTSLSYKPLSNFQYVPFNSNIAPHYKGKIINNKLY